MDDLIRAKGKEDDLSMAWKGDIVSVKDPKRRRLDTGWMCGTKKREEIKMIVNSQDAAILRDGRAVLIMV